MRDLIMVIIPSLLCLILGFLIGIQHQKQQQCTDKCRVKELELQKEVEELKWRYELVNEIKG